MRQFCVVALISVLSVGAAAQSLRVDESASHVVLSGTTYNVVLTANASETQSATLLLEVISPDGERLVSSSSLIQLKAGTNKLRAAVALPKLPVKSDDTLWYRLVYNIAANGKKSAHGILPLFESVQEFALHVSSPATIQRGKKFFVRVHTTQAVTGRAVNDVVITALIRSSETDPTLASATARTDAHGYAVVPMLLPAEREERDLELSVQAQRGATTKSAETDLKVGELARIIVQTDKPLYQPGQLLHVRALAFTGDHHALAAKKLYLQIEDQDGTVVFRDQQTSSRFGVVAADWPIPDRIRLGEYRIIVKTFSGQAIDDEDSDDDDDNPVSASLDRKTVRISRYELPTFVVNATPDRAYYLPDQKAFVDIHADYLFGKPVPKAAVRISPLEERSWNFTKQKWEVKEGESVSGATDDQGLFHAALELNAAWSNLDDYSNRKFRDTTYTAYVTDPTTGRTEERRFDVRISKYPIHIYTISQGPSRNGLPQEFFITTSYADGSPAECDVEIHTVSDGVERLLASAHTSRYGVARVRDARPIPGKADDAVPLILTAHDRKGIRGVSQERIWPTPDQPFIRIITNKTILGPEEPIEGQILSDSDGEVVLELANQSRILRSFTVRLSHRQAMIRIPFSADFTGQLTLSAIDLRHNGYSSYGLSASRSVIFPQDRDLKIALKLDHDEYRPGQDAAATVQVRATNGSVLPAVVGAVLFDKAVEERARIDESLHDPFGFVGYRGWWYPGDAKLANFTRSDIDHIDIAAPIPEDVDIAADFVLNAYGYSGLFFSPVFGDEYDSRPLRSVYETEINKKLQPLLSALVEESRVSGTLPRDRKELDTLLAVHKLTWSEMTDPWGSELVAKFNVDRNEYRIEFDSPGPDKRAETEDDFYVAGRNVSIYDATARRVERAIEDYHARTGGFVRDLPTLKNALSAIGIDIATLLDPWGQPYQFVFGVERSCYTVTGKTRGKDGKPGEEYAVGSSAIDYFAEARAAIDRVLPGKVQAAGKTPATPDEFRKLLLPEVDLNDLRDPYGRPYIVRTTSVARYSDHWSQNDQRVRIEPVTVWDRRIFITSVGLDGVPDTFDDFEVAVFSAVLSETTIAGKMSIPSMHMIFTGNSGGITGVVSDQQEAVVPNVKVVATNISSGANFETTTGPDGRYLLRDLPPGVYDISVQSSGFSKTTMTGLVVRAQEAIEVNAVLRVGAAMQTVEVNAETLTVETVMASSVAVGVKQAATDLAQQATVTPRLRQYFPETLLWQPSIETDRNGRAHLNWKFADNLTTWKLSLIASTLDGRLASVDKEVKSFQPFFVEHDPPKILTLGDRISLPVVVRNYTDKAEHVKVDMPQADWFRATSTSQEASPTAGGNAKVIFPFEAIATTADGKQRVLATSADVADAIERPVAVHPDGAELTQTNGRILSGDTRWEFEIPKEAIPVPCMPI